EDADAYVITYDPGDPELAKSVTITDPTTTSYRLSGLDAEAIYAISIQSVKDAVRSLPSEVVLAEPKLVPDGLGKSWEAVGGRLDGIYPDIEATEEELWVASRDDDGIFVHRY